MQNEASKPDDAHRRKADGGLFLSLAGAIGCILFIVGVVYVGQRLETIEDRLSYASPVEDALVKMSADAVVDGQVVYVPVYSHIYFDGGQPFLFETTLSLRNTDSENSITITSVRYFNTKGEPIRDYLSGPLVLAPLETAEFLVEKADVSGGSGANFLVGWRGDEDVTVPYIEAVMIGIEGQRTISIARSGRPLGQ